MKRQFIVWMPRILAWENHQDLRQTSIDSSSLSFPLMAHVLPTLSLPLFLHTCPAPLLLQGDEEHPSFLAQTPEGTNLITRQRLHMPAHLVGHLDQMS